MTFPNTIWILCTVALLISSIGFKKYVWFISLGYGFSIAGEGLAMLLLFRHNPVTAVACSVFILYGCRLGGYLAYRELKSGTYARHMQGEIKETVPFGVKIAIWMWHDGVWETDEFLEAVEEELGQREMQHFRSAAFEFDEDSVDALMLPQYILKALHRNGIETVEELEQLTDAELLRVKGIGEKSVALIREALEYED